ncbi:MAG: roadblock/LC7 domain-containing protein [Gemmatimonadales bacterium]
MTDDIQRWTTELSTDPDSLVFLELGEALRRRRHLDGALAVARSGVARYPQLAEAFDLLGRIESDRGEGDAAFDAWTTALRLQPRMVGPQKGMGFLFFRLGDLTRSLRHLEAAAAGAPGDPTLSVALARVRALLDEAPPEVKPDPYADADEWAGHAMLLDTRGRVLAGGLRAGLVTDPSEPVAAHLAGVGREAARTTELLGLGYWQRIVVEGMTSHLVVTEPAEGTLLVIRRGAETPPGRLARMADRADALARRWLEQIK